MNGPEPLRCLCGEPSTPRHRETCPVARRAALAVTAWVAAMFGGGCSADVVDEGEGDR